MIAVYQIKPTFEVRQTDAATTFVGDFFGEKAILDVASNGFARDRYRNHYNGWFGRSHTVFEGIFDERDEKQRSNPEVGRHLSRDVDRELMIGTESQFHQFYEVANEVEVFCEFDFLRILVEGIA